MTVVYRFDVVELAVCGGEDFCEGGTYVLSCLPAEAAALQRPAELDLISSKRALPLGSGKDAAGHCQLIECSLKNMYQRESVQEPLRLLVSEEH